MQYKNQNYDGRRKVVEVRVCVCVLREREYIYLLVKLLGKIEYHWKQVMKEQPIDFFRLFTL